MSGSTINSELIVATTCVKCEHPKAEHRYGYGPCRHVDMHSQKIYDIANPDNGREVRATVVFCACIRLAK